MKCKVATTFCFGHRLHDYDGVCRRLHGHNALVTLEIESSMDKRTGMVMDFKSIKGLLRVIVLELDHKMLLFVDDPVYTAWEEIQSDGDDDLGIIPVPWIPTAENIALHIYHRLVEEESTFTGIPMWVTVHETCTSSVTVDQNDAMIGH